MKSFTLKTRTLDRVSELRAHYPSMCVCSRNVFGIMYPKSKVMDVLINRDM